MPFEQGDEWTREMAIKGGSTPSKKRVRKARQNGKKGGLKKTAVCNCEEFGGQFTQGFHRKGCHCYPSQMRELKKLKEQRKKEAEERGILRA